MGVKLLGVKEASSSRQLKLLLVRENQRILDRLLKAPSSAQELVERLGMSMNQVHYRLRQLEQAGLVRVHEQRARKGRAIKVYKAAQERFLIPFSASTAATIEELMQEVYREVMDRFVRSLIRQFERYDPEWGVFAQPDERGNLSMAFGLFNPEESAPWRKELRERMLGEWGGLSLTPQQTRDFIRELRALREKYRQSAQPEGKPHMVGLFVVEGTA